ncbi:MAG: hypothetical protein AB1489_16305 [Acidobacteriota bacterium]
MKFDMCKPSKRQTSYEILSYLVEYPDAQDTLEGVVEWWFLQHSIEDRTTEIKKALTDLVDKGLMIERIGRDSRSHYRINRRKLREILAILKHKPGVGMKSKANTKSKVQSPKSKS